MSTNHDAIFFGEKKPCEFLEAPAEFFIFEILPLKKRVYDPLVNINTF